MLDASVAVRWFFEEETHPHAALILDRVLEQPARFAIPELFCFEVFAVLERLHPDSRVYDRTIIPILQGGILRYPMTLELVERSRTFCTTGLTGYDATYAGLAEMLDGLWLTFDSKAHQLISGRNVSLDLGNDLPSFS